jgi:hypothetical protein
MAALRDERTPLGAILVFCCAAADTQLLRYAATIRLRPDRIKPVLAIIEGRSPDYLPKGTHPACAIFRGSRPSEESNNRKCCRVSHYRFLFMVAGWSFVT